MRLYQQNAPSASKQRNSWDTSLAKGELSESREDQCDHDMLPTKRHGSPKAHRKIDITQKQAEKCLPFFNVLKVFLPMDLRRSFYRSQKVPYVTSNLITRFTRRTTEYLLGRHNLNGRRCSHKRKGRATETHVLCKSRPWGLRNKITELGKVPLCFDHLPAQATTLLLKTDN